MSCNNQATGSWDCTVRLWPLTDGKMNNTCLKDTEVTFMRWHFLLIHYWLVHVQYFFSLSLSAEVIMRFYYTCMASSMSSQDAPNWPLRLASQAGKMELSFPTLDCPPCHARKYSPKAK